LQSVHEAYSVLTTTWYLFTIPLTVTRFYQQIHGECTYHMFIVQTNSRNYQSVIRFAQGSILQNLQFRTTYV